MQSGYFKQNTPSSFQVLAPQSQQELIDQVKRRGETPFWRCLSCGSFSGLVCKCACSRCSRGSPGTSCIRCKAVIKIDQTPPPEVICIHEQKVATFRGLKFCQHCAKRLIWTLNLFGRLEFVSTISQFGSISIKGCIGCKRDHPKECKCLCKTCFPRLNRHPQGPCGYCTQLARYYIH